MAQLNDLIVTGNSRFINKTYTSTADVGCVTASSAAGATEHSAGTTGQALVSDGDSVYWGDPQHANTTDEAQHATSAAALDNTEFIEDNEPYLFRTAPREAGNRVYEDAIVGGSVAWNQLVNESTDFSLSNATGSTVDGVCTFTVSAQNGTAYKSVSGASLVNHVLLGKISYKTTTATNDVDTRIFSTTVPGTATTDWQTTYLIAKPTTTTAKSIGVRDRRESDWDAIQTKDIMICDLTLMFGSTIADYIYTLEQSEAGSGIAWLKSQGFFTKDYYAYNAGGIQSVKTSAKKVVGFNQWDEEWEQGYYSKATGLPVSDSSWIRSKNKIKVVPNTTYCITTRIDLRYISYYDLNENFISQVMVSTASTSSLIPTTFTTPSNAYFINVHRYKTSYTTTCINLHWDGERDGEYEPYVEHTYLLGNDELRGLFKLSNGKIYVDGDIKTSDGTITRKYKLVNLGTRSWTYDGTYGSATSVFKCFITGPLCATGVKANILCAKYVAVSNNSLYNSNDIQISYTKKSTDNYGTIRINDTNYSNASAFTTAMNGVYLLCELATPTTESADPYQNPQIVSNWGTEQFVDERDVPVPVGHDSRYPKTNNYKLANIPAPPGGAGDYIVHTDEYGESVYQQASDIKVNYAGTADLGKRRIFIQGSQTTGTTTGLWTGDASEYFQSSADLTDGQEITYWLPLPTTGNATLNLKFGDGTSSGAVNCYYGGTTRLTTHYGQGQAIHLTYRKNVKIPSTGSTTYTGWWADANYYSDSNTVSSLRGDYTYLVAGPTVGVKQYSLIARDSTGKYSSFTSAQGTAATKPANRTDYYDISKIFYYNGSASVAANGNMSTATLYWAVAGADLRYSLNIGTSTLTNRKPVYLKFDANESTVSSITGATCYKLGGTANNDYWSQTLPTSADGMIYVEIGRGTRDYRMDLAEDQHYYQFTDKLHEYDSWNTKLAEHSEFTDGTIVYKETVADNTNDGKLAFLEFTNTGVRKWNFPSTTGSTYISDKTSPCICRYNNGEMIYVDAGLVDVTLMQNIELTPNKMVYLKISSYNVYDDISASWGISSSPFTQTVTASDQMVLGVAVDSSHFYLLPDNKINDKKGRSGHAYAHNAYKAERLSNNTQIGGGTSAVYFTNLGVPAPIDIAAVTVNNATNAAKVNGTAFGSASTMASGAFASSSHTHTTAQITSFTSAVDDRITRDKILGEISTGATWTGSYAFVEGYQTTASGDYSHAEGNHTTASGAASHAEGYHTKASGNYAHAEGDTTEATADYAHAEGRITHATKAGAHAEGSTTASGFYAHSEGLNTLASGNRSHAEGANTTASGEEAHTEGYGTQATAYCSHAEGWNTLAGAQAHAEGQGTTATGQGSHAGGSYTIANIFYQTAIGKFNSTVANALFIVGNGSSAEDTGVVRSNAMYVTTANNVVIGSGHVLNTINSIAAGTNCYVTTATGIATTGNCSFAFGYECTAVGDCSWAEGLATRANPYSHAEGESTNATGDTSHAEGSETLAVGDYSHAEGYKTTAWDRSCHAEGYSTQSTARYSHAEGWATLASGKGAHSEGYDTTASGDYSHVEGVETLASGSTAAHAEGRMTLASGTVSHAEGNETTASDSASHAEGTQTLASGSYSHAEGSNTTASGNYSHAGGRYTIANRGTQTAIGKYNATVASALFIVGNGSSAADTGITRSNAMYVTTAGNINCVSVTQTSDERLKENINPLTTADKSILDVLEPKQFTLKEDEKHQLHYGFIAQDVEQQINALGFPTSSHSLIDIADNEQAYYSLNYTELIPLLVQKVKDLEARIALLEKNK